MDKNQKYLTLAEAARLLPGKPHPSTVYRWFRKGLKPGDREIRLDARYCGRRLGVSEEALEAFIVAVTEATLEEKARKQSSNGKSAAKAGQNEAIKRAEEKLAELGVKPGLKGKNGASKPGRKGKNGASEKPARKKKRKQH